jgi:hypothetical protein
MEKEFQTVASQYVDIKFIVYIFGVVVSLISGITSILFYIIKVRTTCILKTIELMGYKIDIIDSYLYKKHNSEYRAFFDNEFEKKLNEAGYVKKNG